MLFMPEFWIVVYVVQLLLFSLALGSSALLLPRLLRVPCLSRFLIGFCLAPFALAVWMLLVSAVLPGASRWLFILPPSGMAVVILIRYAHKVLCRLERFCRKCRSKARELWPVYVGYACLGVLVVNVISKLIANGSVPVTGSDAMQYLGYALKFAQGRSLSAVTGFHDSPDGALLGDMHGPLWHAYLSHALMTTGNNPLGYPCDQAVRVAFQVTVIYLLLAVAAFAATCRYWGVIPLSLILLLQVPQFEYISSASSRDGFRIIPLVLLAAILAGLSPRRLERNFRLVALIPVAVMTAFALAGHTLGGIIALTAGLAWAIWALAAKTKWIKVALVLLAMGAGLVLAGPQYLQAYLEIGRVPGANVFHEIAIAGTPMQEAWSHWMTSRLGGAASVTQRLPVLLARDQYRLSVIGLLGGVCAVLLWPKFRRQKHTFVIVFTGLVVLASAIPFTGLLDIGFDLSDWFVRNLRYSLHWYPFAAVCVAMLLGCGYDRLMSRANKYPRVLAGVILAGATLAASCSAHNIIVSKWRTNGAAEKGLLATVRPLQSILRQLPAGKRLLLDADSYNYYLGNHAIVMYTRLTWDVLQAKDENQACKALKVLNVGAVGLQFAKHTGYWEDMPLHDLLANPTRSLLISDIPQSSIKLFILKEEMPQLQLVEIAFPVTLPLNPLPCEELKQTQKPCYDWINRGFRGSIWVKRTDEKIATLQLVAGTPDRKGEHVLLLSPKAESSNGFPVASSSQGVTFACEVRSAGTTNPVGDVLLRLDILSFKEGWSYNLRKIDISKTWRHFEAPVWLSSNAVGVYPTVIWKPAAEGGVLELRAPVLRWFAFDAP